ncbi:MAG TPA: hypothetical protein VFQ76_15285 [Longimicrobiaceae bacterium]|nr:hypothetical protein [Longimicrobiaceae bacterium]
MVRTASNGFSTFLEGCLEKVRLEQETERRLDGLVESAGSKQAPGAAGSRPVRRPPLRLCGFFGSGM